MKKIRAVVLGYGDRGKRYSEYALAQPEELQIIGAIDINGIKLEQAAADFDLPDNMLFDNLDAFLKSNVACDIVINATMDQAHYDTTVKLLKAKYNVLLEKPATAVLDELMDLRKQAKLSNCTLMLCHVLRYTAFYSKIKQLVNDGEIGEITSMQLNEHIGFSHFIKAYVRGKWKNEKECGSGLLLAKCCHDLDLICWINNTTEPFAVSSFGSKATYSTEKAPKGATEFCWECPAKNSCLYNAYEFEFKNDAIPFYTWAGINKPLDAITDEEKLNHLKTSDFGRCVYRTNMDIVDRQCVSISFKNGSIATLNMVSAATKAGRNIHILGTKGELEGCIEDNTLIFRKFNPQTYKAEEQIIKTDIDSISDSKDNSVTGHYGGDYFIMKDLVRYLNGIKTSVSTTVIDDSINGHLCCYAAEKARKESIVLTL